MHKSIVAIVNPVSGHCNVWRHLRAIAGIVRSKGHAFEIRPTQYGGHATRIAAEVDGSVDAILVVGGDGTVCEVANGLGIHQTPLAILPSGTENLLARHLNMPVEPDRAADLLLQEHSTSHDAAVMHGQTFLTVAGVGFDALCVHRMAASRKGHITHLDYFFPILASFLDYDFPQITVYADGREVFSDPGFAILGIIPRYSVNMRIAKKAVSNDGLLDAVMFRCENRFQLLGHAARILADSHLEHEDVVYTQCQCVKFDCDVSVPIQIDGEPGGHAPATCSIISAAIRFLSTGDAVNPGFSG